MACTTFQALHHLHCHCCDFHGFAHLQIRTHAGTPGTLAPGPFQQFNCVINTVVSLLGAAVAAFVASSAVHGKLDMVRMLTAAAAI